MEISKKTRIIILSALLLFSCVLSAMFLSGSAYVFNAVIYEWLMGLRSPGLTNVILIITNLGSTTAVVFIIAALLLFPQTRKPFGIPVAATVSVSAALNLLLKTVIALPRPDLLPLINETGYSFPSGHSMNNAALYTVILLSFFRQTKSKKIRISALICGVLFIFFIGASRIYLGVHYAGDILTGWTIGVFIALLFDTVLFRPISAQ